MSKAITPITPVNTFLFNAEIRLSFFKNVNGQEIEQTTDFTKAIWAQKILEENIEG